MQLDLHHGLLTRLLVALLLSARLPADAAAQSAGRVRSPDGPRGEQPAAAPRAVDVRSWLSQTALWVGDRVTYTVEVTCARNVDILVDDLDKDKLRLDGLEIVGADAEQDASPHGQVIRRFRYQLTTYDVDRPSVTIAAIPVRYYVKREGQRIDDVELAGEIQVPGATLAFRSTIPDDLVEAALRDRIPPAVRPAALALLQPVGVALILVASAPVAMWSVALVRRRRRPARPRTRATRHLTRAALEDLKAVDATAEDARREAYTRLDAILRSHLSHRFGLSADTLTPPEIEAELQKRGSSLPIPIVHAVLQESERARYGPPDSLPTADEFHNAVRDTESVIASAGQG